MSDAKRKNTPEQPELPIEGAKKPEARGTKPATNGNGNGHDDHIIAEETPTIAHNPFAPGKIELPLGFEPRGKVAELEAHLDAKLLIRSTRKLALTEAGQSYLAACRRILDEVAWVTRSQQVISFEAMNLLNIVELTLSTT